MKYIIEAEKLNKTYRRGAEEIKAVDGIDLAIEKGEFVSFVGPSGSGKTTLLHLLGCLDSPTSGTLKIDGQTIFGPGIDSNEGKLTPVRRDHFGYIFQRFYLIPTLTVKENILLPLTFYKKGKEPDVKKIAEKLGLANRLEHLPKEISGGEMQRVAIARALINNPSILLADEPTGNLDSKRCDEIAEILKDLNKEAGITIILVTHNHDLSKMASRTIEIRDGKVRS
jgi:putative ABC transport system ATP-binding protein